MNFRQKATPPILGFQVTPMIDVFCCLLIFFIVTYNFSRAEASLEVKVPVAKKGEDNQRLISTCILNVTKEGNVILNSQALNRDQLLAKLTQLSKIYPDQAVMVRGDGHVDYQHIVEVLDICREANIWNVGFATVKATAPQS